MEKQSNESVKSKVNPELIDEMIKDGVIRVSSSESLTVEDIDDFEDMILDDLTEDDLEDLLDNVDDLLDEVRDSEPEDKDTSEYMEWENNISRIEDFIDEIQDRIDDINAEDE